MLKAGEELILINLGDSEPHTSPPLVCDIGLLFGPPYQRSTRHDQGTLYRMRDEVFAPLHYLQLLLDGVERGAETRTAPQLVRHSRLGIERQVRQRVKEKGRA
jgi:hypothetical protein